MMIKKALSVTIVALAGILMLANTALPHHHHDSAICYQKSHCHNENRDGNESNPSPNHEHDGDTQDVCLIGGPVLLPSGQENHECKCIAYTYNHSGPTVFPDAIFGSEHTKVFPLLITNYTSSAPGPSYSSVVNSSPGLRAPPVV
jgi:hypothetical protein